MGLSYTLNERDTVFANLAKGFQSGGFNYYGGASDTAQYDSAESWNYEIGWFASWNGGRLNTRAAVFYNDFENYQVWQLTLQEDLCLQKFRIMNQLHVQKEILIYFGRVHWISSEYQM